MRRPVPMRPAWSRSSGYNMPSRGIGRPMRGHQRTIPLMHQRTTTGSAQYARPASPRIIPLMHQRPRSPPQRPRTPPQQPPRTPPQQRPRSPPSHQFLDRGSSKPARQPLLPTPQPEARQKTPPRPKVASKVVSTSTRSLFGQAVSEATSSPKVNFLTLTVHTFRPTSIVCCPYLPQPRRELKRRQTFNDAPNTGGQAFIVPVRPSSGMAFHGILS